jgi:hypothetical protein
MTRPLQGGESTAIPGEFKYQVTYMYSSFLVYQFLIAAIFRPHSESKPRIRNHSESKPRMGYNNNTGWEGG